MGEEVHGDLGLEAGGGDLAPVAIELAEEVQGYSCRKCAMVFRSGKALGGHMSSSHGPLSSSKKLKYKKAIKSSVGLQTGKFNCKFCDKTFPSEKGVHGHMRLHPQSVRRGIMKPPTQLQVENPVKHSLEPETLANGVESEHPLSPPVEDFIKSLREKTVTGRRGRRGTKPHKVDNSPETCLLRKRALLSGDPQELRKIMEHHDDSGYFRRAFGKYLDFPWPEPKKNNDIQGEFEMGNNTRSENLAKSTSYDCSNCPPEFYEKMIADSISKDIYEICKKSSGVEESKNLEHGKHLEGIETRLTGKKRKGMDSKFVENNIIRTTKTDHPYTQQGSHKRPPLPRRSPILTGS